MVAEAGDRERVARRDAVPAAQPCAVTMLADGSRATTILWTLGGSSNGRTSGFGPENRGSNPCPPACDARLANSIPAVSAPTVLILAAGQGTRMRSQMPKVLHELCGRPMVLWPVQAALEAGAERVVVVDSPARALEAVLPEGVELAVQERPNGTGGAVVAAMSRSIPARGRARSTADDARWWS